MSAARRKQCRVQGGWSSGLSSKAATRRSDTKGTTATSSTESNTGDRKHGRMLDNKSFVFTDPKKAKMPSKVPYNFSWVIPGLLAGSGLPSEPGHIQYFIDEKIDILVSLTEWKPALFLAPGLHHIHMPVTEFEPPSLKQALEFVAIVENAEKQNRAVAVHCHWGRGRTGTLIACYLMKVNHWDPGKAISVVRQIRPHSIETYQQEQLVHALHSHLISDVNEKRS